MKHLIVGLVAEIHGAGETVIDLRGRAIDASHVGVTGGHPVAERTVFAWEGPGARSAHPARTGIPNRAGVAVIADQGVGCEETGAILAGVVGAGVVVGADQDLAAAASLGALVLGSAWVTVGTEGGVGDVLAPSYRVAGVVRAEVTVVTTVFVRLAVAVVIDAVAALLDRGRCITFAQPSRLTGARPLADRAFPRDGARGGQDEIDGGVRADTLTTLRHAL